MAENYLCISDLQIPFEHPKALEFCMKVQKEFKISKFNIINVGDEIDGYWASRFPKDPDALVTVRGELKLARERLKAWYKAFPFCRVAISNHGMRWAAKAYDSFIPMELIKPYKEIIEAPMGWVWMEEILVKTKIPFRVIHGLGYSGMNGHRNAAIDSGMNTVIGHLHSHAGVSYVATNKGQIWGCNSGCLIDQGAMAFHYSKHSRFKASLSVAVILNDGRLPIIVPFGSL